MPKIGENPAGIKITLHTPWTVSWLTKFVQHHVKNCLSICLGYSESNPTPNPIHLKLGFYMMVLFSQKQLYRLELLWWCQKMTQN